MEAPRGLVVEQLTPVRQRIGFEELSGIAAGKPVSVGLTNLPWPAHVSTEAFTVNVRKATKLHHDGLLRTLAIEPAEPGRFAVLWEREEGQLLSDWIQERGTLLPDDAVGAVLAIAQVLAHAHRNNVLHGGLDASWVLVRHRGTQHEYRVGGFGLGLLASYAEKRTPSVSTDLFALGSLLFLMLTGRVPGRGVEGIPSGAQHLTPVLRRCLALDLSDRYRSVEELLAALGDATRTRVSGASLTPAKHPHLKQSSLRMLGPWELQDLLGEGAMGQVFLARHSLLGRQAAIKVLRPEQYQREDLIQRFFQEARSVNQINHEHIVEISDFGQELGADGKPSAVYFVMELLQGETLTARLAVHDLSVKRAVHVVKQVASALAAAHKVGVVHRDVKSDNVLLIQRHGDPDYVKVLDFGVAKLTQETPDAPTVSTIDGAIIGTPTSMSPEQAQGGTVDRRSDVYAVGVLLYQALAGKLPIDADNFGKLMALLLTKRPDPLPPTTPRGEAIPPALAAVVMRCLEKDPAKRPQSMEELLTALTNADSDAPSSQTPSRSKATAMIAVITLGLFTGAAGVVWYARQTSQPVVAVILDASVVEPEVDAGPVAGVEAPVPDAGPGEEASDDAGVSEAAPPDAGVKTKVPRSFGAGLLVLKKAEDIRPAIQPHIRTCMVNYPDPKLTHFTVGFHVSAEGVTTEPVLDVQTNPKLSGCIKQVFTRLRFPKRGNASVGKLEMNVTPQ